MDSNMDLDGVRNGDPAANTESEQNHIEPVKSTPGEPQSPSATQSEPISLKVTHNKKVLDVVISPGQTIGDLKDTLTVLTQIPADKQKIMWSKGSCPDSATLESLGAKSGSKFMMVGSSNLEVTQIQTKPSADTLKALETSGTVGLGELTVHRKILDKGIPADAMPGILDEREALPAHPISGMLNKRGMAVRLTFKLENDEVWLGTKERTEKIKLGQVRKVVSEPVLGHEEYHVLGLQLGPTEASTYWLYWVPAQYVDAIREVFSQFD